MCHFTPDALVTALLAARAAGDLEAATACYEPDAHLVAEPGMVTMGADAVRVFTTAAMALPLQFDARRIIQERDIALHLSRWTLPSADGTAAEGITTDVLRRQPDGSWRVALDNPWGASAIGGGES